MTSQVTDQDPRVHHQSTGHPLDMKPKADRPKALYILGADSLEVIYGPEERRELAQLADVIAPPRTAASIRENPEALRDVEVIFSGWGAPIMDAEFMKAAPNLKAVFYGAGSVRHFLTDAFWASGVRISSAYSVNALPVAEYTMSVILLSLKQFWAFASLARRGQGWGDHTRHVPGAFRSTVGLISFGMIARRVIELLERFDLRFLVYCPFLSAEEASAAGVQRCSLEEVFEQADVVSLHTPNLPETRGMITGAHFASMKQGATFINTARGPVVRQPEMIEALRRRPDLTAVLDVCDPEPCPAGSPLLELENVVVTPHIAGSHGPECQRLGCFVLNEFRRYLAGEPLEGELTRKLAAKLA
jgi:phosphoglycerate dehydrogenase-like enzyme